MILVDFKKTYDLENFDFLNSSIDMYPNDANIIVKYTTPKGIKVKIVKLKYGTKGLRYGILQIQEVSNIDAVVDSILTNSAIQLQKDTVKMKKVFTKIINSWSRPGFRKNNFIGHKQTWIKKKVLTDNEYHQTVCWRYFKMFKMYTTIPTGCGSDTYYEKDFYEKALKGIDAWLNKQLEEIQSKKTKTKLKQSLLSYKFEISGKKMIKCLK